MKDLKNYPNIEKMLYSCVNKENLEELRNQAVQDFFDDISDREIINLWNEFCSYDDRVYSMNELYDFERVEDYSSLQDIVEKFKDFDFEADYFYYDVYGPESLNDLTEIIDFESQDFIDYVKDSNEFYLSDYCKPEIFDPVVYSIENMNSHEEEFYSEEEFFQVLKGVLLESMQFMEIEKEFILDEVNGLFDGENSISLEIENFIFTIYGE